MGRLILPTNFDYFLKAGLCFYSCCRAVKKWHISLTTCYIWQTQTNVSGPKSWTYLFRASKPWGKMPFLFDLSSLQELTHPESLNLEEMSLWLWWCIKTRVFGVWGGWYCSGLCAFPRRSGNNAERPRFVPSSLLWSPSQPQSDLTHTALKSC